MSQIKEQPYESGHPSHDAKSAIIANLDSLMVENLKWGHLHNLSEALVEDDRLTLAQQDKLHSVLQDRGFLTYCHYAQDHELLGTDLNIIRWGVESDITIQVGAILALGQLEHTKSIPYIQNVLTGLFNIAHTSGYKHALPFADERNTIAFTHLSELDGKIGYFTGRTDGDPNEWDWKLIQTAIPERLAGEYSLRFHQLQEVLYLGYAVGVYDVLKLENS